MVSQESLRATVDSLLERDGMNDHARDYLAAQAKLEALETVKEPFELRASDEYSQLRQRVRSLEPLGIPQLDGTEGIPKRAGRPT